MESPYSNKANWFKGSVHSHTTASDGALTPAESVASHRALGYDFVIITDHRTIVDTSALGGGGLVTIPGGEYGGEVGLGITREVRADDADMAGQLREVADQGGVAVVAHPHWSGLSVERICALGPFHAIDVEGTTLSVRTSPVSRVKFVSTGVGRGKVVHAEKSSPLTFAAVDLEERIAWNNDRMFFRYVRVEIEDYAGGRAWSNPIFL